MNISFPSNAIKDAVTGTEYHGNVNVAAQYIDPTAVDLEKIMPGDLRGVSANGYIKGLTSYGMAAVELTGDAGQLLQLIDGKKSTLTIPMPAAAVSTAPSTIPLWYFDEAIGLWKEDGNATKAGNGYISEVSHFSYWNCDLPNPTVPLTFTIIDENNKPVEFAHIEIVPITSNSWSHIGGYTDSSGYVSVLVTANASYTLVIYGNCQSGGGYPYSQTFSVTNTAVALGNIVLVNANIADISGNITDCANNPVSNGYIIAQALNCYFRYPVNDAGQYHFNAILCETTTNISLTAEDIAGSQQSQPQAYSVVPGINTIGNLQACGISTSQFISLNFDGGNLFSYISPADIFGWTDGMGLYPSSIVAHNNSTTVELGIAFNAVVTPGSTQNLTYFWTTTISDQPGITTPIPVNITEYGPVNGFIAGNFAGIVTGSAGPHSIVCSFKILRTQ